MAFGRICGFWRLQAAFEKSSQQRTNSDVWSIFWLSGGYLVFGGFKQPSKSRHSKGQILMFGAYFGLRQDIWFLGMCSVDMVYKFFYGSYLVLRVYFCVNLRGILSLGAYLYVNLRGILCLGAYLYVDLWAC